MPTNEYGQPTDSKGNVKTQSELIEAELEGLIVEAHEEAVRSSASFETLLKKSMAALVLKHRHDVYFAAYKDGLVQGRKEERALTIATLQGLTFFDRWNKVEELPAEIEKRIAFLQEYDDTPASK